MRMYLAVALKTADNSLLSITLVNKMRAWSLFGSLDSSEAFLVRCPDLEVAHKLFKAWTWMVLLQAQGHRADPASDLLGCKPILLLLLPWTASPGSGIYASSSEFDRAAVWHFALAVWFKPFLNFLSLSHLLEGGQTGHNMASSCLTPCSDAAYLQWSSSVKTHTLKAETVHFRSR
ncbi:hypothetical protein DNTS_031534 [Danionella cerebrum]|uniref:Uncharacterized protein n=1 Tax=Danionella cerebrum TaxID=2873325 RepID=A0A553R2U2_9TELE|nr:hypothetical protein DNTS_031534 [Danionella translucida]